MGKWQGADAGSVLLMASPLQPRGGVSRGVLQPCPPHTPSSANSPESREEGSEDGLGCWHEESF